MLASDAVSSPKVGRPLGLSPVMRLGIVLILVLLLVAFFMTYNSRGNWDFVIPFRSRKVLTIIVVSAAVSVSTIIFQTITGNRILTPAIMGFDSLYMLIQTLGVFFMGGSRLLQTDPQIRFVIDVVAMVIFSGLLFWWLFIKANRTLHLLVLIGIIFGVLFRSFTSLLQRMMDPTDFAVLQDAGFASINSVDPTLVGISALIVGVGILIVAWRNRTLDALMLGRAPAVSIGVDYQREVMIVLSITAILISVSTALVGPITFFGLLVAHLAYQTIGHAGHRYTIPAATFFAILFLMGGQMILEHVFNFNSSLSIMVEFVGGLLFIILLLKASTK